MTPVFCSETQWRSLTGGFIALWTDAAQAYALFDHGLYAIALAEGAYPALSLRHPGADWFERLAQDLNGHIASGATHSRTAIEHFRAPDGSALWPEFTFPANEGAHQIAMGPIYGGITEPAHFRFSVCGEQVLQLQTRLGYSHKAMLALMRGKSPRLAARFAARISGDATVAHSLAFAQAAEAALDFAVPLRAIYLRAVMAELERIANHAGDIGAIAAEAGFPLLDSRFAWHRETICTAAQSAFGHRLMMDIVIPGGIAGDIHTGGGTEILRALDALEAELPKLTAIFDNYASLQDRLSNTGTISTALAERYAAGGVAGRASGRAADARKIPGYAPYNNFDLIIPVETDGDVAARIRIRIAELSESCRLIRKCLDSLPDGQIASAPPSGSGMGLGVAESFRGPVWHWLTIDAGQISDIFIADASTLLWPLLEHAAATGIVSDFPLIARSINAASSAVDL